MYDKNLVELQHEERERVRRNFDGLFEQLAELFYDVDLMGLNYSGSLPLNEYEPEVGTILPELSSCRSADDVQVLIAREFKEWFGQDFSSHPRLELMSQRTWLLWRQWRAWQSLKR